MYLQLTTRCNMKCDHCCFSCTTRGKDMSREVFMEGLRLAEECGDSITLGGGEPTLHPLFDEFLGLMLMRHDPMDIKPFIATNGTNEKRTMRLLDLSEAEVIHVDVSLDPWHDLSMVSTAVMRRARALNSVRDVSAYGRQPVARGRGKQFGGPDVCACETTFIDPTGEMWGCGCKKKGSKLGNILAPSFTPPRWVSAGDCWDSQYHPRHERKEVA